MKEKLTVKLEDFYWDENKFKSILREHGMKE